MLLAAFGRLTDSVLLARRLPVMWLDALLHKLRVIRPGALLRGDVAHQALPRPEGKLVSKEMPQKR
jgi:hypothetical protein